jgi:F-type H+-transporting ATPase subunit gamma
VHLVYTDFISVGRQVPVSRQLIPINRDDVSSGKPDAAAADYEFEPSPTEILGRLLPAAVEAQVYAALLSASASEHASRQRAMKSATDNAEDLIKSLTRDFNQARQAEITTEISEIVGGAEALKSR